MTDFEFLKEDSKKSFRYLKKLKEIGLTFGFFLPMHPQLFRQSNFVQSFKLIHHLQDKVHDFESFQLPPA